MGKLILIACIVVWLLILGSKRKKKKRRSAKNMQRTQSPKTLNQIIGELNDARDNTAVVDDVFDITTKKTQRTVNYVKQNAPVAVNLELDALMSQVNQLVNYANRIAGNATSKNFRKGQENFKYNNALWYRARMAGVAFLQASDLVEKKLRQLHRIDFKNISSQDRQKIKQLQSQNGLIALKRDLLECAKVMFRINKSIKELVRLYCGKGGKVWADKMDKSGEEARFEAKRRKQYGW